MRLIDYKKNISSPLKKTTLSFLKKETSLLLALKKRGFGVGKWNGVGGKPELHESIQETAIREIKEEIGVEAISLREVAQLTFYYQDDSSSDQNVFVFFVDGWKGDPIETEEMKPQWFDIAALPFDSMWPDDRIWLPRVLDDEIVKAEFLFTKEKTIEDFSLIAS